MKKIFILTLLPILFLISSCGLDFSDRISGDFIYTEWTNLAGGCDIKDLSDAGQLKDTIVFPTVLDDLEVYVIENMFKSKITFENATNVYYNRYINSNIDVLYNQDNVNLYISGKPDSQSVKLLYMDLKNVDNHTIYIHESYYNNTMLNYQLNFQPGNVVYYLNEFENNYDIFFIDDCDNSKVNVIPPNPIKVGYEFIGWYTDLEYTNEWNFDNIIPKKQYINDNYIFNETKIYAKFEVIV